MTDKDPSPMMPSPMPQPKPVGTPAVPPPQAPDQQATIDELPEARPHVSIWHHPFIQNVIPFATSLLIHLAILGLGFAAAKTIPKVVEVVREQIIIPDAQIIEGADPGGVPNPGLGEDPNRTAAQDQLQDVPEATGFGTSRTQELNRSLIAGGGESEVAYNPLARGPRTGARGTGQSSGDGDPGGGIAPFGTPGGGAPGPKANFVGMGGNATKVVFVCDASGSMINKFDTLKQQLRQSIDVLIPIQGFNVIFFKEERAIALDDRHLVVANPEGKRRAHAFLQEVWTGPVSAPIPALELAFKQDAQLIFFLTDGFEFYPSNDAVVKRVEQLVAERGGRVKINTIFFGDPGYDKDDPGFQTLKTIAEMTGGQFKIVTERDL